MSVLASLQFTFIRKYLEDERAEGEALKEKMRSMRDEFAEQLKKTIEVAKKGFTEASSRPLQRVPHGA